jgi:hypothetical protein
VKKDLANVKKPLGAVHTRGLTEFLVKFFLRWTRVASSLWWVGERIFLGQASFFSRLI